MRMRYWDARVGRERTIQKVRAVSEVRRGHTVRLMEVRFAPEEGVGQEFDTVRVGLREYERNRRKGVPA